jgi:type VI secretion system protein ImpB
MAHPIAPEVVRTLVRRRRASRPLRCGAVIGRAGRCGRRGPGRVGRARTGSENAPARMSSHGRAGGSPDSEERHMASQSTQQQLGRVRPPRVHITYDVETGGAIEMKELPFVMGVLGDFTGQPTEPLPRLKERKFVEVTPDNFDDVLASMKPHLAFTVENKLSEDADAGKLGVDLHFKSLDDFSPDAVARQVPALRELLELRTKLADLRGSLQGNDKLDEILQATLADAEKMAKLRTELGSTGAEGGSNG